MPRKPIHLLGSRAHPYLGSLGWNDHLALTTLLLTCRTNKTFLKKTQMTRPNTFFVQNSLLEVWNFGLGM